MLRTYIVMYVVYTYFPLPVKLELFPCCAKDCLRDGICGNSPHERREAYLEPRRLLPITSSMANSDAPIGRLFFKTLKISLARQKYTFC